MVTKQQAIPTEILLLVLSFMRTIDLGKLLRQSESGDVIHQCCRFAVQHRAKAQGWALDVLTPAGYAASLCHGVQAAVARLYCVGFDTATELVFFEPKTMDDALYTLDSAHATESLKMRCAQWLFPLQDDRQSDIPITIVEGQNDHDHSGVRVVYDCSMSTQSISTFCDSCQHACHQNRRTHIQFRRISVPLPWLLQGL